MPQYGRFVCFNGEPPQFPKESGEMATKSKDRLAVAWRGMRPVAEGRFTVTLVIVTILILAAIGFSQ
jgi:hypothetical protein